MDNSPPASAPAPLPAVPAPAPVAEPAPAPAPVAEPAMACCIRGCRIGDLHLLQKCHICPRYLHEECAENILVRNGLQSATNLAGDPVIICKKACWTTAQRLAADPSRIFWDKDGKEGPNDPKTSISILLTWLTEGNNYATYRGKKNRGERKINFCQRIANKINAAGVVQHRTAKEVQAKICKLETEMRQASDWKNSTTGAGLMTSEVAGERDSFRNTLLRKCKYFDLLEEIFVDRVSSAPRNIGSSTRGTRTNIFGVGGGINHARSGRENEEDDDDSGDGDDFDGDEDDEDDDDEDEEDSNIGVNSGDYEADTTPAATSQNGSRNQPSTPVSTLNALTLHGSSSTSDLSRSVTSVGRGNSAGRSGSANKKKNRVSAAGPDRLFDSFASRTQAIQSEDREYKRAKMESIETEKVYKARLIQQMDIQDEKSKVDLQRAKMDMERAKMEIEMDYLRNYKELQIPDPRPNSERRCFGPCFRTIDIIVT